MGKKESGIMLATLRRILDALGKLVEVVTVAVTLVELKEEEAPGPEKKAEAIAQIKELVAPLDLPPFVANNLDMIAGFLIDVVVGVLNREGFFKRS